MTGQSTHFTKMNQMHLIKKSKVSQKPGSSRNNEMPLCGTMATINHLDLGNYCTNNTIYFIPWLHAKHWKNLAEKVSYTDFHYSYITSLGDLEVWQAQGNVKGMSLVQMEKRVFFKKEKKMAISIYWLTKSGFLNSKCSVYFKDYLSRVRGVKTVEEVYLWASLVAQQ